MPNVNVKLAARCLVDGVEREAGDVVELDSTIAKSFGEIISKTVATAAAEKAAEKKPNAV